jgi:hypothetical protein
MRDKTIKITLKKQDSNMFGLTNLQITKITNSITVDTRKRTNLGVGSMLSEKEAGELIAFYTVTVIV